MNDYNNEDKNDSKKEDLPPKRPMTSIEYLKMKRKKKKIEHKKISEYF